MDEIVSLVIANGIFAVLFCGLLIFELRDSRAREGKYVQTIRALSDRLKAVGDVKTDTAEIKTDVSEIKTDTEVIKRATLRGGKKGGGECATATT